MKNSRSLEERHGKDWKWNGKIHIGNFKVTSNVLFPKLGSGNKGVYFILLFFLTYTYVVILFAIYSVLNNLMRNIIHFKN